MANLNREPSPIIFVIMASEIVRRRVRSYVAQHPGYRIESKYISLCFAAFGRISFFFFGNYFKKGISSKKSGAPLLGFAKSISYVWYHKLACALFGFSFIINRVPKEIPRYSLCFIYLLFAYYFTRRRKTGGNNLPWLGGN